MILELLKQKVPFVREEMKCNAHLAFNIYISTSNKFKHQPNMTCGIKESAMFLISTKRY